MTGSFDQISRITSEEGMVPFQYWLERIIVAERLAHWKWMQQIENPREIVMATSVPPYLRSRQVSGDTGDNVLGTILVVLGHIVLVYFDARSCEKVLHSQAYSTRRSVPAVRSTVFSYVEYCK